MNAQPTIKYLVQTRRGPRAMWRTEITVATESLALRRAAERREDGVEARVIRETFLREVVEP